jgi:flagellar basal-body rod modification protein FlgD
MSTISGISSTSSSSASSGTGVSSLSSSDFLKLMIQELQQQDPFNPTDANQLLTQMSQISNLQSNASMVSSLSSLTLQQSIGAGGNLIGKTVSGIDDGGNQIQGVVTSVKVVNKQVRLELDSGSDLPMDNVTQIAANNSSALTADQWQQILSASAA